MIQRSVSLPTVALRPLARPLRLLVIDDSDVDTELILGVLRRGGFDPLALRVESQEAFRAALGAEPWDLIISDYALPSFSGPAALDDLRAAGLDIPFILVAASIGEGVAVDVMRRGAHDYILKAQLTRLPAAVERELGEASLRAERARMDQLLRSERHAAAGAIAAGVAHEVNNPLAVLFANLHYISESLARLAPEAGSLVASDDDVASPPAVVGWLEERVAAIDEPLRDARDAVVRIRDIVRDVKMFSRPETVQRDAIDVRRVVESSVRMAGSEIRHRAQLVQELGEVPAVDGNARQLQQVLLHLIANATAAIAEGRADRNVIRVVTRTAGADAVIELHDTGRGIDRANLERVFDPFYTTRPGGSTGLGLAVSRGIVKELGGKIEIDSELGKGTCVRVTIPRSAAASQPIAPSPSPRRARVLVVDDEAAIGRVMRRCLGPHHDVTSLSSGKEALDRILGGERFDVILSDLMMPEVSGTDLHDALLAAVPDQAARMIFVTGGAFTARSRAFLDGVKNPRIEKPIAMPRLLELIAGMLR